jgi:hypothetical protein
VGRRGVHGAGIEGNEGKEAACSFFLKLMPWPSADGADF